LLVFAREDGKAGVEFSQDTSKAPHIDCHVVVHAENDLRGSVESTLDVGIDFLVFEAATTKVDDLQSTLGWMQK
jgi:hypothetical protein